MTVTGSDRVVSVYWARVISLDKPVTEYVNREPAPITRLKEEVVVPDEFLAFIVMGKVPETVASDVNANAVVNEPMPTKYAGITVTPAGMPVGVSVRVPCAEPEVSVTETGTAKVVSIYSVAV